MPSPGIYRQAGIYLFKVNNENNRTRCETCSKLTATTPERRQWRRSDDFIVNFQQTSSVSIAEFEQENNGWVVTFSEAVHAAEN